MNLAEGFEFPPPLKKMTIEQILFTFRIGS